MLVARAGVRVTLFLNGVGQLRFSRFIVAIGFFVFGSLLHAQSANEGDAIPVRVLASLNYADIPRSSVSLVIQQLGAAQPLVSLNSKVARNPASTAKILTTYTALETLTPAFVWRTEVYLEGELQDGVLRGDLGVKGFGDPLMLLEDFWKFLRELRRKGVRRIEGDLVLDDSYFAPINEDMSAFDNQPARTYNLPPNALLVNFQTVRFVFNDTESGMDIYMDPTLPNLRIENRLRARRGACGGYNAGIAIQVRNTPQRDLVAIDGLHPTGCQDYSLSRTVLQPDSYFYGLFKSLWEEMGGEITGTYRSETLSIRENEDPFMTWWSKPFREVLTSTNKFSNNTMTRNLLLTIAAETKSVPATTDDGIAAITEFLDSRGMDTTNLHLDNGSGLSREVRVDAQLLVDTLVDSYKSPNAAEFIASLPINGIDGTMRFRTRGESSEGMGHIKTGRLDDVVSLAGIFQSQEGIRYALAFIINHKDAHRGIGVDIGDVLLDWLYYYEQGDDI